MSSQKITLNLIPSGDTPVFYASQYDNGRPMIIELLNGEDPYEMPEGYSLQLNVRKVDSKIVVISPESRTDNNFIFTITEQMTACSGENIATVTIYDDNGYSLTTLNFILKVQRDVLQGGVNSETEINNLTTQVTAIVNNVAPEVVEEVATPIVRNIAIQQIERYGGTWLMSVAQSGEQRVIFSDDIIGDDLITAYKVFSDDDSVTIDHYEVSPGELIAYFDEPVQTNTRFLLQYFRPF